MTFERWELSKELSKRPPVNPPPRPRPLRRQLPSSSTGIESVSGSLDEMKKEVDLDASVESGLATLDA